MERAATTQRRFFKRSFSLRTGLILFIALGASLGMAARWVNTVLEQGEAQKWLVGYSKIVKPNAGSALTVTYAPESGETWTTALIRKWVHAEYHRRLSGLNIDGAQLSDEAARQIERVGDVENIVVYSNLSQSYLSRLVRARGLKGLFIYGNISRGKDALDLKAFAQARTLERLEFQSDWPLSKEVIEGLSVLPNLQKLWLHGIHPSNLGDAAKPPMLIEFSVECRHTSPEAPRPSAPNTPSDPNLAKMFDELSNREKLNRLRIFSAQLSDPSALTRFCEASNIRYLHLEGCHVTPECLREFAKLKKVETLHLHWSPMTHEHLEILATMKTLRGIHALRCDSEDVTNAALAKLKTALPRCKITRYLR